MTTYVHTPRWSAFGGTVIQDWPVGSNDLHVFPASISRITDVVGNKGGFNPVDQVSLSSSMKNMNHWFSADHDERYVLWDGVALPYGGAKSFIDWPWMPDISAATLSDWSLEAYDKFQEQVPTSVSLANFLYELKDMKGMIPSIDRLHLAKSASNNFLAFEFGVLPFVSDIKAILNLTSDVNKRIQHLLLTQGKSTNLSFNRSLSLKDETYIFSKSLFDGTTVTDGARIQFRRASGEYYVHIGAKLYQDLKDLHDANTQLKALAAAGGFNHPARVVWNAIPYSFIVDWFFHVGKLLDTLTIQPFGGTYEVSRPWYSVKTQSTFYASQIIPDGAYNDVSSLGIVTFKGYKRLSGFPASSLFLTNGTLSPMQLALSAAMIHQRIRT